jgi:hypothetical protein
MASGSGPGVCDHRYAAAMSKQAAKAGQRKANDRRMYFSYEESLLRFSSLPLRFG